MLKYSSIPWQYLQKCNNSNNDYLEAFLLTLNVIEQSNSNTYLPLGNSHSSSEDNEYKK
jgi:hypothetical protein